jgi:hypothetical protein
MYDSGQLARLCLIADKTYNTLVLWYFGTKGLRHWLGKRKFLLRSQRFYQLLRSVGLADPKSQRGSFRREFPGNFLFIKQPVDDVSL